MRFEERIAKGKALREKASRSSQAEWKPPADRRDAVDILVESSAGRLEELLPIRYGRMMVSPFTFYRGAAAIMAYDLTHTPSTDMNLVACGDCHLLNFGGFATTERNVIFDINDFDEVSIAPWEWDVKWLAASFVIAGRSNGFAAPDCRAAAWTAAQSYRQRMAEYASMPVLLAWNDSFDLYKIIESLADEKTKRFYIKKLTSATEQSAHEKEFAKLTFQAGASPRIIDQPPLIFHSDATRVKELFEIARKTLNEYKKSLLPARQLLVNRFNLVDVIFKVVGVSSVGPSAASFC
jgi:uncharacterized protein (DUF2252 family)